MIITTRRMAILAAVLLTTATLRAHSGPPFPIVETQTIDGYNLSIWTDPDSTDDGSLGGRFWIVIDPANKGETVPAGTHATVTITPSDRPGAPQAGSTAPENGSVTRQFVGLLMDHEGPYRVRLVVDGPLGRAEIESKVDATYDERPAPYLVAVYIIPFLALGGIWIKALMQRRKKKS